MTPTFSWFLTVAAPSVPIAIDLITSPQALPYPRRAPEIPPLPLLE
jgi:hypothetical protein